MLKKKIKQIIPFVFLGLVAPHVLFAQSAVERMRESAQVAGDTAQLNPGGEPFQLVVVRMIRGFLGFLGVLFLVLIMYGGFMWMTSGGNEERVGKAKKIIGNSVIGLAIIVVSYGVVFFVFDIILKATNQGCLDCF